MKNEKKTYRVEKVSIINEVIARVKDSSFCFLINYGGVKVDPMTALRRNLEKQGARVLVVKNTYLTKIAQEQGWPAEIGKMLVGPTAIVTGNGDVSEVAKILVAFVKDNEQAKIKGADFEKALLSPVEIEALSKLPNKDTMRAMLLSTFNAPATKLVRVMNASMLQILYALKAYEEKGGGKAAEPVPAVAPAASAVAPAAK